MRTVRPHFKLATRVPCLKCRDSFFSDLLQDAQESPIPCIQPPAIHLSKFLSVIGMGAHGIVGEVDRVFNGFKILY